MPNPIDTRIATENRVIRELERRKQAENHTAPLPTPAELDERLAVHGTDSGSPFRTETRKKVGQLLDAVAATRKNPTKNQAQIEIAVADMVQPQINASLEAVQAEREVISRKEAQLERDIDQALSPDRPDWPAAEIRSVLLDMNDKELHAFLKSVAGTRDDAMVRHAIASVPAVMSGVSHETHRNLRDTIFALKDPTLFDRPKDLAAWKQNLDVMEDGIRRTAAELVDMPKANALRALAGGTK